MSKDKDLKNLVKREKLFSTLAHKEGLEAKKRSARESRKGWKYSAKDSSRESSLDERWSKKRKGWASKAEKEDSDGLRRRGTLGKRH